MVTKLIFKPHSLSSHFLSPHPFSSKSHLYKFQFLSLLSINSQNQAQPLISTHPLKYGPSLLKGENPPHNFQITQESEKFDEDSFTRVFDIAAIRVPSKDCFALETRLRGHLLNWPRVRNIARVPGDDFDDEFSNLSFSKSGNVDDEEDVNSNVSLNRRVYGKAAGDGELLNPVLYRDKLANTFDSKGFVKFRNLAKMSRPKTKKKGTANEEKGETMVKKGFGRNDFVLVEVVEEDDLEEEDLSGLLGEEFKGRRKWRGSTRLLLLDERYAGNDCIDELPEAIKVAVPSL